jgi:acyl carrier protein
MNETEILSQMERKIRELLSLEQELGENDNLEDKGLDSVHSMQLIIELEKLFDIEFDDDDLILDNFSTIKEIYQIVSTKL